LTAAIATLRNEQSITENRASNTYIWKLTAEVHTPQ